MRWLSTNKSGQEVYELWNTKEKLLTLTCQHSSGTLRITADDEKRVFLIGREGFLRSRTVLRNEYGIRIGQLNYENSQDNTGTIAFNNEKFNYAIRNHSHLQLVITKNDETIATCELPVSSKRNSMVKIMTS